MLDSLDTVCFDKTGTLTKGVFEVTEVYTADGKQTDFREKGKAPEGKSPEGKAVDSRIRHVLEIAAHCECYSTHPIAASIIKAYEGQPDISRVSEAGELSGRGVKACVDGREALVGSIKLMKESGILAETVEVPGRTICYVAYDGAYLGAIAISDVIKESAYEGLKSLKQEGIRKCIMLTGDLRTVAEAVVGEINAGGLTSAGKDIKAEEALCPKLIDEIRAELLPQDKVETVESLLDGKESGRALGFVGDGINDAPVLMRADIGFAMGSLGSDSAIEAADVVIMDDDLRKIGTAKRIAGRTLRIVRQNIVFAIGVKVLVLILGALGLVGMWAAVFADVGVAVLAILNSMRALKG